MVASLISKTLDLLYISTSWIHHLKGFILISFKIHTKSDLLKNKYNNRVNTSIMLMIIQKPALWLPKGSLRFMPYTLDINVGIINISARVVSIFMVLFSS